MDIREAGINVEKFASPTAAPAGTPITYTVRVTNVGSTALNRAGHHRWLPDSYVTIEGGSEQPGAGGPPGRRLRLARFRRGVQYTYTYTLQVNDPDPYVNRVAVTGYAGSTGVLNTAQAVVDVQGVAVGVEKDVCLEDAQPCRKPARTWPRWATRSLTICASSTRASSSFQNISIADTLVTTASSTRSCGRSQAPRRPGAG